MPSKFYEQLSHEGKVLVDQAMEAMTPSYDPEEGLIGRTRNGKKLYSHRTSMYYALGLMLQGKEGHVEKTEKIIRGVAAMQVDAPGEIFHGAFVEGGRLPLVYNALDFKRLGPYARYYMDCFYEKMADGFRLHLEDDPELAPYAAKIEKYLNQSTSEVVPLVWASYDPNMREFNMMSFAMLLEHFSDELSPECIELIDHTCQLAMEGAVARSKENFTPLNTNIQCMHTFLLDYFGTRWNRPDYCEYAIEYGKRVVDKYLQCHSAAEFNSPTYCGVDLATLGFWQRYTSNDTLKELGKTLEEGIWNDMMEFYNPAMKNFGGPYSRAYELDMAVHTCFHALFYYALGEETFPEHPVNCETPCDVLMVFGGVNMPQSAKDAVFAEKKDVVITHQFRELSERGDPDNNDALCTATSWISPDLMTGAIAGSENPSHQLHPLVVFWRGEKGLGTIKVLRSYPNGDMQHMHYVYFNGKEDREHLTLDVDFQVNRDVKLYFEIEYPGVCESADIAADKWSLPGLTVQMDAKAPEFFLEKNENGNILKVCYMSRTRVKETKQMHFDMVLKLG